MTRMIPDFDAKLAAWLDDDQATGKPETDAKGNPVNRHRPSDGAIAAQRAFDIADSHALCPRDERDVAILVAVYGQDQAETIISIPPERSLGCVLRAMYDDDAVIAYKVLGAEPPAGPDEDEHGGEIPVDMTWDQAVATVEAARPATYPRRRQLLTAAALAAAALIAWRLLR